MFFFYFEIGMLFTKHIIIFSFENRFRMEGARGAQWVGLPNNSYKPITNTAWVRVRLCNLQKGCTRLAAASDKVYQLLAHGRWSSLGTPVFSTTKTGRHDISEILLKVALSTINQSIRFRSVVCWGIVPRRWLGHYTASDNTIGEQFPQKFK